MRLKKVSHMSVYEQLNQLNNRPQVTAVSPKPTSETTPKPTSPREVSSDKSRQKPRSSNREATDSLPTRDEIQEFSFRLRDELKVKVQAEVPHRWQKELEDVARQLNVKKLELYRFILGEFLGKVKRR